MANRNWSLCQTNFATTKYHSLACPENTSHICWQKRRLFSPQTMNAIYIQLIFVSLCLSFYHTVEPSTELISVVYGFRILHVLLVYV